jgi:hypothetical protein
MGLIKRWKERSNVPPPVQITKIGTNPPKTTPESNRPPGMPAPRRRPQAQPKGLDLPAATAALDMPATAATDLNEFKRRIDSWGDGTPEASEAVKLYDDMNRWKKQNHDLYQTDGVVAECFMDLTMRLMRQGFRLDVKRR